MEKFLEILRILSGPVIGAVIGYFTNYIAVKMLFRPYRPVMIGKWQLPLTPGIIPKRQSALAKAVGQAVGENLFTGDDLSAMLLSDEIQERVADSVLRAIGADENGDPKTVADIALRITDADKLEDVKQKIAGFVTEQLISAAESMDIGAVVASEGERMIYDKRASLGMLSLVLSDRVVHGLVSPIADRVNTYVSENGRDKAYPAILERVEALSGSSVSELLQNVEPDKLRAAVKSAYSGVVSGAAADLLKGLNIAAVVEEKVDSMDVKELETLCMSVMKKELSAIVNLGALIGFILGLFNLIEF